MSLDYARRGFAEFIGAFALVFVGVGSVIANNDLLTSAVAHGLVIAVFVSAFGGISGGHFNPAVTFGFLVTRRIQPSMAVFYWVVQLLGAAFGALLIRWIFPPIRAVFDGAPQLNTTIGSGKGMVVEGVLTFFLVLVVFATAVEPDGAYEKIAGLAIGFTILLDITMGGRLTGAAMNPARAFGPELVSGHWADAWVWYVGPLAGGALAALLYDRLYLSSAKVEPEPHTVAETPRKR
ncbi:MAG TPA: aquaporin [Gaiellaceae bacterium]|jgi:MIP family channel proteins